MKEMKVLNIAQPHAHKIFNNGKNVENRTKPVKFRGSILIYASKTKRPENFEDSKVRPEQCSFGAIIGVVDLTDCIAEQEVTNQTKKWFIGDFGYVLKNPLFFEEPIFVKPPQGAITWWTLEGAALKKAIDQIGSRKLISLSVSDKKHANAGSHTRMTPSKSLAAIIGDKSVTFDGALKKFIIYVSRNDLKQSEYEIRSDANIKKLFGKNIVHYKEVAKTIQKNLG